MKKVVKKSRRNKINNFSQKTQKVKEIKLESYQYFPSTIYAADISEFLNITKKVSDEFLRKNTDTINEIYPVKMTENLFIDPRLEEFNAVILNLGWDILNSQGYDMSSSRVVFSGMWTQQHHKYSLMEQHLHNGDQLVGFYFLRTPENCSKPVFYDPRPSKVITDLPETNLNEITHASSIVNFSPSPGRLFITNTYLPHSFTKNASDNPTEFIHFNMRVVPYILEQNNVEII